MSVNKDFFKRDREFNYDFQSTGAPQPGWGDANVVADGLVPTHCCFCGVQCGMNLRVSGGRVIGVEPREYPHNQGSLCPKGIVAYQQQAHPERLLHPLIRRGGKGGQLERATWDEALSYVVSRWKEIQAQHGKDAVAVYSGSSMTNEKCYLAGKFARVGLRTRNIDYNGRLCMSSSAGAYAKAFGVDRGPMPMTDFPLANCILVAGTNISECFPIAMQWIWRARDRGASLIVIDPRETPIARTADLWLPVRPGTDIAVLNAMLKVMHRRGIRRYGLSARAHHRLGSGAGVGPRRLARGGRTPLRRTHGTHRHGGAYIRWGGDLAHPARERDRAQHARRRQLPRLHQSGAGARAGRQTGRRQHDAHRTGERPGRPGGWAEGQPAPRLSPHRRAGGSRVHRRRLGHSRAGDPRRGRLRHRDDSPHGAAARSAAAWSSAPT